MKAREIMTSDPKTCSPDDSLQDAIAVMREEDCGLVPIVEGGSRVVGVLTDRDIALHLGENDAKPSEVRIEDAMISEVVTCEPDAEVSEVSRKMEQTQIRRILVCEDRRLVGVISTSDLARETSGGEIGRVIEKISEPSAGN